MRVYGDMTAKSIDEVRLPKPVWTKERLSRAHIHLVIRTNTQTHRCEHTQTNTT